MKAIIISGFIFELSDNIIPFLNKETDVYVHTWTTKENQRWITKLKRYEKYCNKLVIVEEQPLYSKKLHSYFYSTWAAFNLIQNTAQYKTIVKFKPNLDSNKIEYKGELEYYHHKAYIQSRPLLQGVNKEDCIYGSIYYQTMDERIISGYPLAFSKAFHILYKDLHEQMLILDIELSKKYGEDYEGSIFWMEWFKQKSITLIQDLDLKIPNNK